MNHDKYITIIIKNSSSFFRYCYFLFLGLHFFGDGFAFDRYFFSWLFRYLHVLTGIMWIGLLWYFNFVQIPSMPNIPDEQKPAIGKVIAPKALFWFRWAALGTIITGLIVILSTRLCSSSNDFRNR